MKRCLRNDIIILIFIGGNNKIGMNIAKTHHILFCSLHKNVYNHTIREVRIYIIFLPLVRILSRILQTLHQNLPFSILKFTSLRFFMALLWRKDYLVGREGGRGGGGLCFYKHKDTK